VDGGDIVLLGRVEVVTAGRYADRQTDLGSSLALGARALKGALLGSLPGAVFGAVLLAVATTATPRVLAAGAGGGAVLGASLGILLGLLAVPSMAGSWERTFAPMVPGGVVIGVRVENHRTERRASRVLHRRPGVAVRTVPDLDDLPDGPLSPDTFRP
jgi:hypothetical protein